MNVVRYGVHWTTFDPLEDPLISAEISKSRPAVIVSDNAMNSNLQTVVDCPLTTSLHPFWRFRVQVSIISKASEIAVDQIRTIAKQRSMQKISTSSAEDALKLRLIISEMYGHE